MLGDPIREFKVVTVMVFSGLLAVSVTSAEIAEAPLALQGRAQGNGQGQAIAHQQKVDKGNVGYNTEQGFAFRCLIAFDLSGHLVDVEEASKIELVTQYQWGGQSSASGWEYICLGAYDDADFSNHTVLNWGEPDGNRYAKLGTPVGMGDPSEGKTSFGQDGRLTLEVTEAAQRSGVSVEKPYLWFRVQAANSQEPESWGGLAAGEVHTRLRLHVGD
ncbi:MAG: hypothetical protein AAGJ38_01520 [Planctomycetota bacterium]